MMNGNGLNKCSSLKYWWVFLSLILIVGNVQSAPESKLLPYWDVNNPNSTQVIDHSVWQQMLTKYVVIKGENNLFSYGDVTTQDKTKLANYIQQLASISPLTLNKNEQYAYWVNLYNALTVDLIIKNYPIKSITKLGGVFSFGPWGDDIVTISGKTLTLNDIEHRILRPIWKDYRTHYAVNCASLGCPNLQTTAFTSANKEKLLVQAEHDFVNSAKGVNIKGKKVQLSSIYEWFVADFGGKQSAWQYLVKQRPELGKLDGVSSIDDVSYEYNWNLNDAK